jgi:hypothetical protein
MYSFGQDVSGICFLEHINLDVEGMVLLEGT